VNKSFTSIFFLSFFPFFFSFSYLYGSIRLPVSELPARQLRGIRSADGEGGKVLVCCFNP
jgi:hypothetical protein